MRSGSRLGVALAAAAGLIGAVAWGAGSALGLDGLRDVGQRVCAGGRYEQLWYVVRNGVPCHAYLDAADPTTADVFAEVFRTRQWSG